MNSRLLRIVFEAAGTAAAGVLADQARKQIQKHGPEILEKAPEAIEKARDGVAKAAEKIKNFKFKK